ncbi:ribonuclease H [Senna tora]|uniref:Ribonuclease H n=1 Tax=Senna tora TaxID=362788 RepID=A0A834X0Z3_9FABA|nr:ribonuclease H [Senna tora]
MTDPPPSELDHPPSPDEERMSYRDSVRGPQRKLEYGDEEPGEEEEDINKDDDIESEESSSEDSEEDPDPEEGNGILVDKDAFDRLNFIISDKEWKRLSRPFRKSLIIKPLGKTIGFKFLLRKFDTFSDQDFALTGGPWIILDHYLTVRPWTSLFDPNEQIQKLAAWVHLPGLPIELYDEKFLYSIGGHIGKVLRIDANTSSQLRGKFARICVELDLSKPLRSQYSVHGKVRRIEYGGLHFICFECGVYGYDSEHCRIRKEREEKEKQMKEKNGEAIPDEKRNVEGPQFGEQEEMEQREISSEDLNQMTVYQEDWKKKEKNPVFDDGDSKETALEEPNIDQMEIGTPSKNKDEPNEQKEPDPSEEKMDVMIIGTPIKQPEEVPQEHKRTEESRMEPKRANPKDKPPDNGRKKSPGIQAKNSNKSSFKGSKKEGAAGRKFYLAFKKIKRIYKPDMILLFETRCSGLKVKNVIKSLGYQFHEINEARGFSGGIWAAWNQVCDVHCVRSHEQFIHLELTNPNSSKWSMIDVYASPQQQVRDNIWPIIEDICNNYNYPVVVAGDFNEIAATTEQKGVDSQMCKGVICSKNGLTAVKNIVKLSSDHHPMLIDAEEHGSHGNERPFRSEACWMQHDNFKKLIKESWNTSEDLTCMLNQFKDSLRKWNRDTFGNIKKRKNTLLKRIKGIQEAQEKKYNPFLYKLGKTLSAELEQVLNQEEALWFQKARCQWIKDGFKQTQEIGKYLGANLIHGRHTKMKYSHITERIKNRLAGWKANCLSLAGRATLTQSVLSTIPYYFMQHSSVPKGVLKEIERLNRSFLWGSTTEKRKQHQVSWSKVCMPRQLGGLGIRSLEAMNKAFHYKLLWQLLCNQNSLWVKVVANKYKERAMVHSIRNTEELVKDFTRSLGYWDVEKLCRTLPSNLVNKVVEIIPPDPNLGPDHVRWEDGKDGVFSISSEYYKIMGIHKKESSLFWTTLWKCKIQERSKLTLWRLMHDQLPSRSRLGSWSSINPLCLWCQCSRETNMHALRDCPKIANVWKAFINPKDRALFFSLPGKEWVSWNLKKKQTFYNIPWPYLFSSICSLCWNWRNTKQKDLEFEFPLEAHRIILYQAKTRAHAWIGDAAQPATRIGDSPGWIKLEGDWVKLNVDGAVSQETGFAGCGGVLRNCNGCWVKGFMCNLGKTSVICAELWGIFLGLKLAKDLGARKVIMECDSLKAVQLIQPRPGEDFNQLPMVGNIRKLLNLGWEAILTHVPRTCNNCADMLAKSSIGSRNGFHTLDSPPCMLSSVLLLDNCIQ